MFQDGLCEGDDRALPDDILIRTELYDTPSDEKATFNVGLTGDMTESFGFKTGISREFNNQGQMPPTSKSQTTSFTFGFPQIVGLELKLEVKTREEEK